MEYGLIGERLSHSHSPAIHKMLGDYAYELRSMPPEAVSGFMKKADFKGINVTFPYKKAVIPYLLTRDKYAVRTGSVNTVVKNRNGDLIGFNTDYPGFLYMVRRAGISFKGEYVLVLGNGGTGQTARAVSEDQGASRTVTISRSGTDNYQNLAKHRDATVIVNTTPVGMYPDNSGRLIDLALFPKLRGVADVIYNPLSTRLILQAKALGITCTGGLPMLAAQGVCASGHFQGKDFPDARIDEVTDKLTAALKNLVLIGMPGSGKTTFARRVAERLGREMADIDDLIAEKAGKSIPAIFAEDGENAFRNLESAIISDLGKRNGLVIATGGGCVLLPANRLNLKQNAAVIYLDRDTERLATDGRPLSADSAALAAMRIKREPIYLATADAAIKNDRSETAVLAGILEAFGGAK